MSEPDETYVARLEAALDCDDPFARAYLLAVELRDAGMPQPRLLGIFDIVRARHHNDVVEHRYNALLDVMDYICGWCSKGRELYPRQSEAT